MDLCYFLLAIQTQTVEWILKNPFHLDFGQKKKWEATREDKRISCYNVKNEKEKKGNQKRIGLENSTQGYCKRANVLGEISVKTRENMNLFTWWITKAK